MLLVLYNFMWKLNESIECVQFQISAYFSKSVTTVRFVRYEKHDFLWGLGGVSRKLHWKQDVGKTVLILKNWMLWHVCGSNVFFLRDSTNKSLKVLFWFWAVAFFLFNDYLVKIMLQPAFSKKNFRVVKRNSLSLGCLWLLFLSNTGMGIKRPAEEDYNSNLHVKRVKDDEDGSGQQATLRFLLESKVRTLESIPILL